MGTEIERRFLVREHLLPDLTNYHIRKIKQSYLCTEPAVRVRLIGDILGFLTIKGPRDGATCPEFEWDISRKDATELGKMHIGREIEKARHVVGHIELDEFFGHLKGRWIAEVELKSLDEEFEKPLWLGDEITGDERYSNLSLALYGWPEDDDVTADEAYAAAAAKVKPPRFVHPELLALSSTSIPQLQRGPVEEEKDDSFLRIGQGLAWGAAWVTSCIIVHAFLNAF